MELGIENYGLGTILGCGFGCDHSFGDFYLEIRNYWDFFCIPNGGGCSEDKEIFRRIWKSEEYEL